MSQKDHNQFSLSKVSKEGIYNLLDNAAAYCLDFGTKIVEIDVAVIYFLPLFVQ